MGAIYLAQDSQLGRLVALKVPHLRGGGDDGTGSGDLDRFYREAAPRRPSTIPISARSTMWVKSTESPT